MPIFHCNLISDKLDRFPDEQGVEFQSLEEAYLDTYRAILEISFDMLRERRDPIGYSFAITDQSGALLLEIPFAEALRPRRHGKAASYEQVRGSMSERAQRHRELRAEIAAHLSRARRTVAETRLVLQRSRSIVD